ncbi:DUF2742 domain-containing protein [Gordonia sp. i37]|uniref:DUF2742 domain-containing protein n=1 Tax=Gordonia sp. i37 TaxID=1961707 RepID=UPI0009AE73CD|nr:hypothetical protein B1964_15465 [Gordonia sp. i37]
MYRRPVVPTLTGIGAPVVLPIAGSPEWAALNDTDSRKLAALVIAGSRWVLERELDEIHCQRSALKQAAAGVSEARDWAAVARRVRDRDEAIRSGAYIPRKVS